MWKSNCSEIVFWRRIANTAACSSKRAIVRYFSLIGARRDFDNRKLKICFLEHSEKLCTYATAPQASEEASQNILNSILSSSCFSNPNYRGIFI